MATWLLWLRALATEVPPTLRVDLLLTRLGPGRAALHTLELTEAGFSLLGWRGGPAKVTGATSPLYLPYISPISPLHLPYISRRRACSVLTRTESASSTRASCAVSRPPAAAPPPPLAPPPPCRRGALSSR